MPGKTRGELEAEFSKSIVKLEKEFFGRGPADIRTFFVNDMILVRLRGILTPAEIKLAETPEGYELIKRTRRQLLENTRGVMEQIIQDTLGCSLLNLHTDMSAEHDERVIVFTVDQDINDCL